MNGKVENHDHDQAFKEWQEAQEAEEKARIAWDKAKQHLIEVGYRYLAQIKEMVRGMK